MWLSRRLQGHIYDEVRKRRLKATRLARQLRFRPVDVDAHIESNAAGLT